MDILSDEVLKYVGLASIALFIVFVLILFATLVLTYLMFKNNKIIRFIHARLSSAVIKILLLFLDFLYLPSKKIISMAGGDDNMVDVVGTEMRNILYKGSFSEVPYSERIVVVPQCLRSLECPTKFSSVEGAKCVGCGRCKVNDIAKKAAELGYKGTYIAPGGGFVKRIIKKTKPKAVVGLGCPYEVYFGLLEVSNRGIPCQGVSLLNSGCVTTDVDLQQVYEVLELRYKE